MTPPARIVLNGQTYILADSTLTLAKFTFKFPDLAAYYKSSGKLATLKTALGREHSHALCKAGPKEHWWNLLTGDSINISFHHSGSDAPTVYDLPCPKHYEL